MKSPYWFGLIALFLGAPFSFAGSHHAQSAPSYVPTHAAHGNVVAPGSTARFQAGPRNFSRATLGGQRVTNASRPTARGQRITNATRFNQPQRDHFGSRGRFDERARVAARSHNAWWWRNHHHDRIVFINTFGCDPLFFDPWFYGYYPGYYSNPYGYYSDSYPYGYDAYGAGGYGPGPGYGASDNSYDDDATSDYSYGRSSRNGGGVVLEVQRRLARDGYYRGSVDGVMGSRTRYAIRAYERDHGLGADGEINEQLLHTMGVR